MAKIELSAACDAKLKRLVTDPFEQTRESLLEDLIDAELKRRRMGAGSATAATDTAIRLKANSPESLYHTKIDSATVDGKELHRPNWNGLREYLHTIARKKLSTFKAMASASGARLKDGKYEKDGFKHVSDGNFSIQGVDANWCWRQSLDLARTLGVPIALRITWRDKEGAAYPGKSAVLEWPEDVKKP